MLSELTSCTHSTDGLQLTTTVLDCCSASQYVPVPCTHIHSYRENPRLSAWERCDPRDSHVELGCVCGHACKVNTCLFDNTQGQLGVDWLVRRRGAMHSADASSAVQAHV